MRRLTLGVLACWLASATGVFAQTGGPVNLQGSIPATVTLQNAATANGNGTVLTVDGYASATLTVNCSSCAGGTTVNFEVSEDGTNFVSQRAMNIGASTFATSLSTAGITVWEVPVGGFKQLRARIATYNAGTVTVTGHAVPVPYPPHLVEVTAPSALSTTDASTGTAGSNVPGSASYGGGRAATALPTATSAGQLTGFMVDKFGRLATLPQAPRDLVACQGTTISASTAETTVVTAAGSSVFADPYLIIVSNTSASTNTRIDVRDATAGSVLFSLESFGGQNPTGFVLPIPIPQTTANNNWTMQAATSTTDLRVYVCYIKNK